VAVHSNAWTVYVYDGLEWCDSLAWITQQTQR